MKKTAWSILGVAVFALLTSVVWGQGMGSMGMMDDSDMPMMGSGMGTMGGGMGQGSCGMMGNGMGMMGGGMGQGSCGMMGNGMGMMGSGPFGMLDLSAEQRTMIKKIRDDLRKQHWAVMGKMMDEQAKLRDLYEEDKLDAKKITAVSDAIQVLRKQMIESRIEAFNRMREVLTKEQREQLSKTQRGGRSMMGNGNRQGGMMGQ